MPLRPDSSRDVKARSFKGEPHVSMALAMGKTIEEAARLGGVSTKTVQRRLGNSEYGARIAQHRSDLMARALGVYAEASVEVAETLIDLMRNATSEHVRLGAAKALYDNNVSMDENQATQGRIKSLEKIVLSRTDEIRITKRGA